MIKKIEQLELSLTETQVSTPMVNIKWSRRGWKDKAVEAGYRVPAGSDVLDSGGNFMQQLTYLLDSCLNEASTICETNMDADKKISELAILVKDYLNKGEELIKETTKPKLDWHQLVHIEELSNNYLRTLIQFFDALLQYPEQADFTTRPASIVMLLHPELCGLRTSKHILDSETAHQESRVPYSPPRVGQEITYEEIANIYRTSRVNVRQAEIKRYPHMRARLGGYEDELPR